MILGTICCRAGSKGVLSKNTKKLSGIPLIHYTIETAQKSEFLNDLLISTDDNLILEIAEQNNIKSLIRPEDLCTDTASKWPVFIHAVENYEKLTNNEVTYLVDMDVTVPLKTFQDIDNAIKLALENPQADVIITGYDSERNPYFNMMEIKEDGFSGIVKTSEKPIVRRQDAPKVLSLTPAAYVVKKSALYEFEHWAKAKCLISEMPRERALDIDTEFDFKLIEFILNEKNR